MVSSRRKKEVCLYHSTSVTNRPEEHSRTFQLHPLWKVKHLRSAYKVRETRELCNSFSYDLCDSVFLLSVSFLDKIYKLPQKCVNLNLNEVPNIGSVEEPNHSVLSIIITSLYNQQSLNRPNDIPLPPHRLWILYSILPLSISVMFYGGLAQRSSPLLGLSSCFNISKADLLTIRYGQVILWNCSLMWSHNYVKCRLIHILCQMFAHFLILI